MERDPDIDAALRELWKMSKGKPRMKRLIRRAVGVSSIPYLELTLELDARDNYTEFFLWLKKQPPEHDATRHYRDKFKGRQVTIVDVGANAGIFTLPVAPVTANGSRFILFEPNPRMLARLNRNVELNDMSGVEVVPKAVGDRSGNAELNVSPVSNLGLARLDVPFTGGERINVPVVLLHEELAQRKVERIDLLKVDIEGLEDRALIPLLEHAPEDMLPAEIYFEDAHQTLWAGDLIGALRGKGYELDRRFGGNAAYSRKG
jgi:FkbM family methyltransferase